MQLLINKSRILSPLFMLLGGVLFITHTLVPLFECWQSVQWQSTPATITHLELVSWQDDDDTLYRLNARYHYEFGGRQYHSDQVSLLTEFDTTDSYWLPLHKLLQQQQHKNQVMAWVNPDNPREAVLDRSLRPWLFIISGSFAILSVAIGLYFKPEKNHPQADSGEIYSEQKNDYQIPLFVGSSLLALAIIIGLSTLLLQSTLPSDGIVILIFTVIAAAITWQMMRRRQRYFRLGRTPVILDPNPASANGHVGGVISIAGQLQAPLTLTLQCIHRYTTSDGDSKKTVEDLLWSEQSTSWPAANPQRHCFAFTTEGQPATTDNALFGSFFWRLRAKGQLAGADNHPTEAFNRSWLIPVSEAKAHTSLDIPDNHAQQTHRHYDSIASDAFRVHQQGQQLHLVSANGRNIRHYLGRIIGGVIFAAIGLAAITTALQTDQVMPFGYLLFTLIGVVLLLTPLWPIGKQLDTRVSPGGIFVERTWFSLPIYRRSLPCMSPKQLRKEKTSSQKIDGEHREFYTLYLSTNSKNVCLAEDIDSSASADALLERMRQALTGHLDEELGS